MNRAFSWKDQSAHIFKECLKRLQRNENKIYDKHGYQYDSEESDDDDEDDLKTTDNSVFEMISEERNLVLQELSKVDSRISRWREHTNIIVSPSLPPRRTKCFSSQAQQILAATKETLEIKQQADDVMKKSDYKENSTFCQDGGSVTFKFQYLIMTERLKVTIVKGSNLFTDNDKEDEMETVIEVCLMPGKVQRQTTTLCKGTRNPIFDTVKHFHGFSLQDIHRMNLRIQIKCRIGTAGPLKSLGDVTVELTDFDIVGETCLQEFVNSRITTKSDCHEIQRTRVNKN